MNEERFILYKAPSCFIFMAPNLPCKARAAHFPQSFYAARLRGRPRDCGFLVATDRNHAGILQDHFSRAARAVVSVRLPRGITAARLQLFTLPRPACYHSAAQRGAPWYPRTFASATEPRVFTVAAPARDETHATAFRVETHACRSHPAALHVTASTRRRGASRAFIGRRIGRNVKSQLRSFYQRSVQIYYIQLEFEPNSRFNSFCFVFECEKFEFEQSEDFESS